MVLDLGYKEAEDVFTYIDDRYIQNYAFNADSKERNQTYCIGLADSFFEYFSNRNFSKLLDSGNFVYIDSHFVINDSKYVKVTDDGGIGLTDYAKQNMHECCLRFDLKLNKAQSEDIGGYYADVMFKSAETVTCNPIFNADKHNMGVFNRSEELKKFHNELMTAGAVAQSSAKNFCQLAWMHIERTHCAYKETFRERTLLSDKTFDRIKKGELPKPELETVMAICFGLQLGAGHGTPLLRSAGFDLTDTQSPDLIAYHQLLYAHNVRDIFEANEILVDLNMKPLCEKEYRSILDGRQKMIR
ncbi:hypothetical protein FACS189490_11850 [Clostridia bacterium]|nr:hypothetical protein FACS189490_11850 [Clostridia bacterium]